MHPADLHLTTQITGYQTFLFLSMPLEKVDTVLTAALDQLGVGLENMHTVDGHPSTEALQRGRLQYLRAETTLSQAREVPHEAVLRAQGLIRLEAATQAPLLSYTAELTALLAPRGGTVEVLTGVQRPRSYTSHAMTQFAYAPALPPLPAAQAPFGVVTPQKKIAAWWAMDWMHRESFFLPRYDKEERMIAPGHALAAADGIPCITRRLVHAAEGYGRADSYDFLGYFEFAAADATTFRAVMAALRDTTRNPEWKYVREGPEWWGRRVACAADIWARG